MLVLLPVYFTTPSTTGHTKASLVSKIVIAEIPSLPIVPSLPFIAAARICLQVFRLWSGIYVVPRRAIVSYLVALVINS